MSTVLTLLELACTSKACAPPPVGSGGSNPAGSGSFTGDPLAGRVAFDKSWPKVSAATNEYLRDVSKHPPLDDPAASVTSYCVIMFGVMNDRLRKGIIDETYGRADLEGVRSRVHGMDRAFHDFGYTLGGDTVVHRGMKFNDEWDAKKFLASYVPGAEFRDSGFVSTSLNESVAHNQTVGIVSQPILGVHMRIRVPSGTRVLAGMHEYERELILRRGNRFRVVALHHDPETKYATMDVEMFPEPEDLPGV